jgi:hypothetical protein
MKTTKELKCALQSALLAKDITDLTDTEVDIMYHLALDEEVQEVLREAEEKEKGDNDVSAPDL